MKTLSSFPLIALSAIVLSACAKALPQPGGEIIRPGDRLGDFLITTGDSEDVIYVTKLHCPYDSSTSTESCEQPVGTKVNVGMGVYDDSPSSGKTLDEFWSEQTHEMTIEGRPVDLQSFGSIDFNHPAVGTVRVWNVVIVADKPGRITARSSGVWNGEPWDYTAILTFLAP
jgi:hypothetical protein